MHFPTFEPSCYWYQGVSSSTFSGGKVQITLNARLTNCFWNTSASSLKSSNCRFLWPSQDGHKPWIRDDSHRLVSGSLKGRLLAVFWQCAFICFEEGGGTYHLHLPTQLLQCTRSFHLQDLGLRLFADTAILTSLMCLLFVVVNTCVACQQKSKNAAWHWDYGRCWCCGFVWCFPGHAHVWHHVAWCSSLAYWNHLLFTKLNCIFQ